MSANVAYFGGIVTDGLVLCMDAGKRDSYPGFGTTWRSVARGATVAELPGRIQLDRHRTF